MYGTAATPFHAKADNEALFDVAKQMRIRRATRALVCALRVQLQLSGCYRGSKLALMDEFGVTLSVFARDPVVFSVNAASRRHYTRRKQFAAPKKQTEQKTKVSRKKKKVDDVAVELPTVTTPPAHVRRMRKKTKHISEEGYDD